MNRREILRLQLQTGDRMTVTQDLQSSVPLTFTVLRGTALSVLRVIPLSVSRGDTVTFISFAVESDWVLCMNASCHQGFVPLSYMERSPLPPQPSVGISRLNDAMSGVSSLEPPPHPQLGRGRLNDAMFGVSSLQPPPQPPLGRGQLNDLMSGMPLQQQPHPSHRSSLESGSYDDDYHSMATAAAIPFNFAAHSRDDDWSSSSSSEEDEYLCVRSRQRGNADAELLEAREGHIIQVLKVNPLGMVFGQCLQTSQRGFILKKHLTAATPLDLEPWYVGKCSRDDAERMLQSPSHPGKTFLLRESDREACYVIGIRADDTIRHRKINSTKGKYYAWMGHNFDTLENLVQYHITRQDETNIGKPYNKFPPGVKCHGPASAALPLPPKNISSSEGPAQGVAVYGKDTDESMRMNGPNTLFKAPQKINATPVDQSRGLKMWYIDENKISPGHVLGAGHYGEVRLATIKDSGLKVAMKTFKREEMDVEDFKNEAVAMKDLRHPYLVKLLGMSSMDDGLQTPCIIMKYHALGSLENYCKRPGRSPLSDVQKAIIAKHVSSGMKYLTDCDYIHRDLAARNVLLASDLTPRIADFGLAKCMLSPRTSALDDRMPWKWTAPEVLGDNKQWTTKCDVWSYGVLLWELYTNCLTPSDTIWSKAELLEYLKEGKRLKIPDGIRVSGIIAKVMKDCWTMRVEERTTFSRIQKDLQIIDVTVY